MKKTDNKTIIFFGIIVLIFILIVGFLVSIIVLKKEPKELIVYYKDTKDFMIVYGQSPIQHRTPAKLNISHIKYIDLNRFKFNYYVFFVTYSLANIEFKLTNGETLCDYSVKKTEKYIWL